MIRFLGLLFLVFLALKLAEIGVVSTWSWWWVTAPLSGFLRWMVGKDWEPDVVHTLQAALQGRFAT